jgi:hypothetical protein
MYNQRLARAVLHPAASTMPQPCSKWLARFILQPSPRLPAERLDSLEAHTDKCVTPLQSIKADLLRTSAWLKRLQVHPT